MTITFSEIDDSPVPRIALEHVWSAAAGGAGSGLRDIYVMAERVAAGTGAANSISEVFGDGDDAESFFGAGSFGAFIARQVFRGGKLRAGVVRGVAVAESGGAAATQIIRADSIPTTSGVLTFNVAGAVFTVAISASLSVQNCANAIKAAYDALDDDVKPPFTAAVGAGAGTSFLVTWTAGNKGAQANTAPCYQIITGAEPATLVITVNGVCFGLDTGGLGAVAGSQYPTITTALANLADVETPIIVHAWDGLPNGSTGLSDLIRAHLETKCNGEGMKRGTMVTCVTMTVASAVSWVAALDDDDAERCRVAAIALDPATASPGTWHAAAAAYVANAICQQTDPAYPFANVALPYMVKPPAAGDILTGAEVKTLIQGGVTALNWSSERARYLLVRGVGCRLFGGNIQDWAIVDGSDYYRTLLLQNLTLAFPPGTKLAEDGETNLDDSTTTPSGILDVVRDTIFSEPLRGILRNRETLWEEAQAEIDAIREGQVNLTASHAIMMGLYTIAGKLRQRGGVIG